MRLTGGGGGAVSKVPLPLVGEQLYDGEGSFYEQAFDISVLQAIRAARRGF